MATKTARKYTYTRPWLYPKQLEAVFDPARISVIEASTKAGKTVGCLAWILEQAIMGGANWNHWWVAPIYPQGKIAYRRLKQGLPPNTFQTNESELTVTLPNKAVIWFKGGDHPDSLYGEDVYSCVMDEATRIKEESYHAIRTTLTATRGPLRIIGNVKGRKNWAYQLARRAESGEPEMAYHKLTAHDAVEAGILSAEEVESARHQLPESVYRELYLAEPSDDAGNPFGLSAIRACIGSMSVLEPDVWGWDLAKSVDYTVGIALDAEGKVCRFERWQAPWEDTVRRILALTGAGNGYVDSTGVGDPIVERLQKAGARLEGFKFSSQSKQQIMEGLAVAIQKAEIAFPDGVIVLELEQFEYVYSRSGVSYSAPESMHDDCVCALALAVAARNSKPRIPSWWLKG